MVQIILNGWLFAGVVYKKHDHVWDVSDFFPYGYCFPFIHENSLSSPERKQKFRTGLGNITCQYLASLENPHSSHSSTYSLASVLDTLIAKLIAHSKQKKRERSTFD
jgi:hypothetical protein